MSDAHLTERQLIEGPEPVDLTEEPIRLSNHDPEDDAARRGPASRHRRIALAAALVVGLAGAGVLGAAGWRVAQQKDTRLTAPVQVAGLTRDDSERARSTADYLRSGFAAEIDLDHSFGTVYRDPPGSGAGDAASGGPAAARPADEKRAVLLFGGTTLLWQPERDLDSLFGLMADETGKVDGVREVPAGGFGGVMKCGTTSGDGGDFAVCGWADHGSVAMAMFPNRSVEDAAGLFRQIREGVQTRD